MKVQIKTKLTPTDMFRFNLYDAYHSLRGWRPVILALIVFTVAALSRDRVSAAYTLSYCLLGFFMLIYMPVSLRRSSEMAVKSNPLLAEPLEYTFEKSGITLHTEVDLKDQPQTDSFTWDMIYKVVITRDLLLIYMNAKNAHVLPLRDIGDDYSVIKAMIAENVEEYKLKI